MLSGVTLVRVWLDYACNIRNSADNATYNGLPHDRGEPFFLQAWNPARDKTIY